MIDFGLNRLLDNSLEITIFGIIQELITNITKHTHAKNSSIRISFYD
jgi:signal transduction histidine kinase|tara:strand:- start:4201 stop:4341 length:141 start_codon:yes stop_codon:yes gene_type:complete